MSLTEAPASDRRTQAVVDPHLASSGVSHTSKGEFCRVFRDASLKKREKSENGPFQCIATYLPEVQLRKHPVV